MDPIPIPRLIEVTGGRWRGRGLPPPVLVLDVVTDSRAVLPGALFVALKGSRVDGGRFVTEALSRGAPAALVAPGSPGEGTDGAPLIEVPDTLEALERLAAFSRDGSGAERIAITGTVGKTTTKEFLGSILARRHAAVRAPKSFNNRLGVSLTLLLAGRSTRFVICEVGASGPGELARLSRLVKPSLAVVTEIGQAHLQGFGDLAGVIRAKSEVFDGLLPRGTAFLKEDAPGREKLEAAARAAGGRVVLFGWERGDYAIAACRRDGPGEAGRPDGEVPLGFRFRVREPGGREEELHLPLPGAHNVLNALAAVAVARHVGLDWAEVREGVEALRLPPLRFAVKRIAGVTVIDDTYNASIRSVLAALKEAGEIAIAPGGRRFLVLGDLLELGEKSEEIHGEIGREVARDGRFDGLFTVGTESRHAARAAEGAGEGGRPFPVCHHERMEEAAERLEGLLAPGDLVLFKASRAVGLERAAEDVRRRLGSRLLARAGEEGEVRACSSISIN